MGSSTEKANNGFSEEEQRISSQLEDLQLKKLVIMKCLEMPELEETTLVSPWDLTELSLIPRTKIIILPGGAGNVKSFIGTSSLDLVCRRLWQNYISRLLWESEEDGLTEEKKRNPKTLVSFRNNRKNKVTLLKKPWIPLCSPVCYRGKQLSTLSYSTLGWDGQCSPLVSVHRTCCNSKRNDSFRSKNHTVYNKISPLIRQLKQQTSPASRRQPQMWNFFAVLTTHVQHVVTCRCPEVKKARTWGFTSRWELEFLIFCFDHFWLTFGLIKFGS